VIKAKGAVSKAPSRRPVLAGWNLGARGLESGRAFAAAVSRIGPGIGTFLLPWSMANLGPAVTTLIAGVGAGLSQWLAARRRTSTQIIGGVAR